jgi:hypothetical protein
MEELFALMIGIGLSAACGFRVFVPLLVMSIAAQTGHLQLAEGFRWVASPMAAGALGVATVLEIAAYTVPWVDNLLDSVATPAAVVAGILATSAVLPGTSPLFRWSLAVIAGGGTAGIIQASTVLARATSSATTGGLANPLLSAGEAGGSLLFSILAVLLPLAALLLFLFLLLRVLRRVYRRFSTRRPPGTGLPSGPA